MGGMERSRKACSEGIESRAGRGGYKKGADQKRKGVNRSSLVSVLD
jgi:hypothetical protein